MSDAGDIYPKRPEIALLLNEYLPVDFGAEFREELRAPSLNYQERRLSAGPYAGLEYYLPSTVMIFIATAYFSGPIQKLGEAHFAIVKSAAKALWARATGVRLTAIGSAGKVSASPKFSLAYSIIGEIAVGVHFKLLISTEVTHENAAKGIDSFLNLIRDIHHDNIDPELMGELLRQKPIGGVVLVTYDYAAGRIVAVDSTT